MPESSLIVPVVVPTGSLHFATIKPDGIVQDVINALLVQPEVTSEVLGDLDGADWALLKIRVEKSGRQWEEEDLEKLGDGQSHPSFAWKDDRAFDRLTHYRYIGPHVVCVSAAQLVRGRQRYPGQALLRFPPHLPHAHANATTCIFAPLALCDSLVYPCAGDSRNFHAEGILRTSVDSQGRDQYSRGRPWSGKNLAHPWGWDT